MTIRWSIVGLAAAALAVLPAVAGARATHSACPMSHVHYAAYPGVEPGLGRVPWIASEPAGRFKAHLFFYDPRVFRWASDRLLGARIFTTRTPRQINPKVLWITRAKGYGRKLTITGRRLDAPGSFAATYPGFGDYPSYVQVPAPGCWRVTVRTGKVSGSVVFSAPD